MEIAATPYRVLARKYRPQTLAQLIGQEALVRTLTNAIATGRVAHAFLLTGIRGVGKTTTARIIARALNCVNGPTIDPCGVCEHCVGILSDRHMDVLEMDAASRTSVTDVRELIETVQFAPTSARYKVYIIDEVHMLSNNAFNALLKTLEEPPPHVKFVFATTELRKVPVTILSRCQRFDLRRVEVDELSGHLRKLCELEGVSPEEEALALIAKAAEGSVRDSLSLLDQAMALGQSQVLTAQVKDMLGLADRSGVFALFTALMAGEQHSILGHFQALVHRGADPLMVMNDLAELTHFVTRVKLSPALADDISYPEAERQQALALAQKLSMPVLARAWQVLLKGFGEVKQAPNPAAAAEMVLVRLCFMTDLPSPEDVLRCSETSGAAAAPLAAPAASPASSAPVALAPRFAPMAAGASAVALPVQEARIFTMPMTDAAPEEAFMPSPTTFEELVALFAAKREPILHQLLKQLGRVVRLEVGILEITQDPILPVDFASRVGQCLKLWTAQPWTVALSHQAGQETLAAKAEALHQERAKALREHPLVQEALAAFPGADIERITT